MAEVTSNWNGFSEEYKVTMDDHYGFSWEESSGVPPLGEASFILPPHMASTGLQPEGPNPYLGKRDASIASGNAERQTCDMDDVCREGWDAFSLEEEQLYSPWTLGEKDLQSLFADLHSEDYVAALDIAMCNMVAEGEQPFSAEWQVRETVRSKESDFEGWSSK